MISNQNIIISGNYESLQYYRKIKAGCFFKTTKISDINLKVQDTYSCREMFSYHFESYTEYIGFYSNRCNIQNVNHFFKAIQKKLHIQEENGVEFFKTDNKNAIIVKVPYFWRQSIFRRNLFTLFLRAAACYYNKNYKTSLQNYPLAKKIAPAIRYFLNGYIYYTSNKINNDKGIVTEFKTIKTRKFLLKKLSKTA